jgi:hypothetical protein
MPPSRSAWSTFCRGASTTRGRCRGPSSPRGVRAQIARAGGYGLTTERQVATYVSTAWILGIDFDTRMPYFRDVLRAGALDPDRKAEILADHTEEITATLQGRA